MKHSEPFVKYVVPPFKLLVQNWLGADVDVTDVLGSGRTNYAIFQRLTGLTTGLLAGTEGAGADLVNAAGDKFEVKAYFDETVYPRSGDRYEHIHTSASATFGPNNYGPVIRDLLKRGDYEQALNICRTSGYDRNDYYIYTNTRGYTPGQVFSYIVLPVDAVVANLSPKDPRIITRATLLALTVETVTLNR